MDEKEIQEEIKKINQMTRIQMATLWRFSKSGHIYFRRDLPLFEVFEKRFKELGGFSPEISKIIGWRK